MSVIILIATKVQHASLLIASTDSRPVSADSDERKVREGLVHVLSGTIRERSRVSSSRRTVNYSRDKPQNRRALRTHDWYVLLRVLLRFSVDSFSFSSLLRITRKRTRRTGSAKNRTRKEKENRARFVFQRLSDAKPATRSAAVVMLTI